MDTKDYEKRALATAVYPKKIDLGGLLYTTLGLCGEAGEVSEKVKKIIRDRNSYLDDQSKKSLLKEYGDCLWYINASLAEIGYTLEDAMEKNLEKLESRKERGKLQGSGDDR